MNRSLLYLYQNNKKSRTNKLPLSFNKEIQKKSDTNNKRDI